MHNTRLVNIIGHRLACRFLDQHCSLVKLRICIFVQLKTLEQLALEAYSVTGVTILVFMMGAGATPIF